MDLVSIQKAEQRTQNPAAVQVKCRLMFKSDLKYSHRIRARYLEFSSSSSVREHGFM